MYLYFTSKGAIFAALQAEGWDGLRAAMDRVTEGATGSRGDIATDIIAGLVGHFRAHPELLRLDALGHGVIEPNLTPDELAAFKQDQVTALAASADRLDRALGLCAGKGLQILLRSYALVRGLWRSFPFAAADDVAKPADDFHAELTDALHEYWRGALT